ncbi:hypothetical protein Ciccas_011824, partial [Cichlidogyrus casuarinus]
MFLTVLFVTLLTWQFASLQALPRHQVNLFENDPEMFLNATQIILSRGYQTEEHTLVTSDQYILTMNRILPGKTQPANGKVIFLQHGLLDSAHTWINNPSNQSLGFILADHGYDVWLSNSRGSTYSQKHVKYDKKTLNFWEFSWDEMVYYDLPAMIDYILNRTAVEQIYYVGHSQGTEIFFAHMNQFPESQSRIKAMVALAPVAYLGNVESPIHYMSPFCQELGSLVEWFGVGEFLPSNKLIKFLAMALCEKDEVPLVCSNIIYLLAGFDKANTNKLLSETAVRVFGGERPSIGPPGPSEGRATPNTLTAVSPKHSNSGTRLPIYVSHTPAGTSVQNIIHYCQSMNTGKFQHFDFGHEGNMERYGQPTAPAYGLGLIKTPMAVFWGGKDWMASPKDVRKTLEELGDTVRMDQFYPNYNHLDFVWGMDAAQK